MVKPLDESKRAAFLNLFEASYRPAISKFFFDLVRSCSRDILTIDFVLKRASVKSGMRGNQGDSDQVRKLNRMIEGIKANPDATSEYIDFIYAWEKLTPAEKETHKWKRAEPYINEFNVLEPPTHRQLSYLVSLGYSGSPPANKLEASKLINQLAKR